MVRGGSWHLSLWLWVSSRSTIGKYDEEGKEQRGSPGLLPQYKEERIGGEGGE